MVLKYATMSAILTTLSLFYIAVSIVIATLPVIMVTAVMISGAPSDIKITTVNKVETVSNKINTLPYDMNILFSFDGECNKKTGSISLPVLYKILLIIICYLISSIFFVSLKKSVSSL